MARIIAVHEKLSAPRARIDEFLKKMSEMRLGDLQASFDTGVTSPNLIRAGRASLHTASITYRSCGNKLSVDCRGILAHAHTYPDVPEKFSRTIAEHLPYLISLIADEAEKIAKREGFA
jgi:hypothetical protein